MPGASFIDGEDVTLRTIEEDDLEFLQQTVNDREVREAIGRPFPVNDRDEQSFFEEVVCGDEAVNLLVTAGEAPAGTVSLNGLTRLSDTAELGYWIAPEHHREGYGSEAVSLLVSYGFRELGLHRIEACVFEFNDASQGLVESLGFTREGVHREAVFARGKYQDTYWYGLLEDEWRPR